MLAILYKHHGIQCIYSVCMYAFKDTNCVMLLLIYMVYIEINIIELILSYKF